MKFRKKPVTVEAWTSVDREPPLSVTKDARPGVLFTSCRGGSAASDSSEESRK